jgi:oxygen-independent coproporphyrinogen-3 oxidase
MSFFTTSARIFLGRRLNPYKFVRPENFSYRPRINQIGLYIHIPFCKKICNFCPYNKIVYDKKLAEQYIPALKRELNFIKKKSPSITINSIYVGGGTPVLLKEGLGEIFEFIQKNFETKGDIGVELHPTNCDERTLDYLKEIGVSLVSVGIQSFNRKVLERLTRYEIDYDLRSCLQKVLNAGFKSVDADLIFGMKDVSKEIPINDFETAIKLGCDQISTYPLIPFTFTPVGKDRFNSKRFLALEKQRKIILDNFVKIAEGKGYYRSSVWSFTKKGSIRYSSVTRNSFVGIGAGATSLIGNLFTINTFSITEYIKETMKRIPIALCCKLSERDEMLWWLFWQCYNTRIESSEFKELFKKDFYRIFHHELNLGRILGFLSKEGNNFYLTKRGSYIFNLIEQAYTHDYLDKTWKTCMLNPWPEKLILK